MPPWRHTLVQTKNPPAFQQSGETGRAHRWPATKGLFQDILRKEHPRQVFIENRGNYVQEDSRQCKSNYLLRRARFLSNLLGENYRRKQDHDERRMHTSHGFYLLITHLLILRGTLCFGDWSGSIVSLGFCKFNVTCQRAWNQDLLGNFVCFTNTGGKSLSSNLLFCCCFFGSTCVILGRGAFSPIRLLEHYHNEKEPGASEAAWLFHFHS